MKITDALLKVREKRKWQIALRRYVLEQKGNAPYAPYFGLDASHFRSWIEIQFDHNTTWDTFSKNWQFDHIVPVAYFDFNEEADLRLCWNFINIRVEKLDPDKTRGVRTDLIAIKHYFISLFDGTGHELAGQMIKKIEALEASERTDTTRLQHFLRDKKPYIDSISSFTEYEYAQLNEGIPVETILDERAFHRKMHGMG